MRRYLESLPKAITMTEQEKREMTAKLQGKFKEISDYPLGLISADQIRILLRYMMSDLGMGAEPQVIAGKAEPLSEDSVFMFADTIQSGSGDWTVHIRRDVKGYWQARYFQNASQ
jgi:hypothetical protein